MLSSYNLSFYLWFGSYPRTTHRASGAPRIASLGFGKPLHDFPSLPCSMVKCYGLSVTQKRRVSPVRRKGLTLLPRIARRPQHLPSGRQLRSPERSTHFLLSSYDMPDSSGLGKPPSRTLLFSHLSCRTDSLFSQLSTTKHSYVFSDGSRGGAGALAPPSKK